MLLEAESPYAEVAHRLGVAHSNTAAVALQVAVADGLDVAGLPAERNGIDKRRAQGSASEFSRKRHACS